MRFHGTCQCPAARLHPISRPIAVKRCLTAYAEHPAPRHAPPTSIWAVLRIAFRRGFVALAPRRPLSSALPLAHRSRTAAGRFKRVAVVCTAPHGRIAARTSSQLSSSSGRVSAVSHETGPARQRVHVRTDRADPRAAVEAAFDANSRCSDWHRLFRPARVPDRHGTTTWRRGSKARGVDSQRQDSDPPLAQSMPGPVNRPNRPNLQTTGCTTRWLRRARSFKIAAGRQETPPRRRPLESP